MSTNVEMERSVRVEETTQVRDGSIFKWSKIYQQIKGSSITVSELYTIVNKGKEREDYVSRMRCYTWLNRLVFDQLARLDDKSSTNKYIIY